MIDITCGARGFFPAGEGAAHVLVGKHVTGTDDHDRQARRRLVRSATISSAANIALQRKISLYRNSNLSLWTCVLCNSW
jgi:RNA 3'-terminal phosphate cyclase